MNTTRHTKPKITVSSFLDFKGQSWIYNVITKRDNQMSTICNHLSEGFDIYNQDALWQDLLLRVISLALTLFSKSPGSYEVLTFGTFEGGTNCALWVWKIFIMIPLLKTYLAYINHVSFGTFEVCTKWHLWVWMIFMPLPPLGAEGIVFLGCPSVHPWLCDSICPKSS